MQARLVALTAKAGQFAQPLPRTFFTCTRLYASQRTPVTHRSTLTFIRSYIRPHYYQQKSSLSKAMERQKSPIHQLGRRINNMDPRIVLGTIIGANVGVYFYWQFAIGSTRQFGDYSRLQFMRRHFTNSIDNFKNGRIYTLLTYAFSHQSLNHLGVNMLVLWSMGTGVISAIGASRFLLLYSGASVVGGLVSLAYQQYLRPALEGHRSGYGAVRKVDSVGASAGVMGITTFFACAFPRATFLVFFIVPMPAIAVVGLYTAYDLYTASTMTNGIVDSAGHLGGVAAGAAYWFLRVKPLLRAGRF